MSRTRQRRNKGEGSITKTPSGKYKATITIGMGLDGKQKRKSVTRDTKREVIEAIAVIKATYGLGNTGIITDKTIKDVCIEFIDTKSTQLAKASLKTYKTYMHLFVNTFGANMLLKNVNKSMIEMYFKTQLKGQYMKVSSLKRIRAIWSVMMNYAVSKGYISTNAVREATIPFPRVIPKANTMILPTPEEFKRLIEIAMKKARWYGVLLYLASVTGMRRGELLGLKWSCVDKDNKTITINNQVDITGMDAPLKTKSSYRTIHVTPKAFELLDALDKANEYVFMGVRHRHPSVSRATLDAYNHEVFKEADMPKGFTFHDIRHYHATRLLEKGINPKVVSRRLGHSSIATTLNIYFNYLPSMDEEASLVLDE